MSLDTGVKASTNDATGCRHLLMGCRGKNERTASQTHLQLLAAEAVRENSTVEFLMWGCTIHLLMLCPDSFVFPETGISVASLWTLLNFLVDLPSS